MQFSQGSAAIRVKRVVISTYPAGEPDHNPMFLEKRVYQGSSGAVYPFAVSLPDFLVFDDDLTRRNRIFCTYLEGLGRLGLSLSGGAREVLRDLESGWTF